MSKIEWSPSFNVGIDSIDSQHIKIVDMINELHEGLVANKSNETMTRIFNNMMAYVATHFSFEESLMEKAQYPEISGHKEKHKAFENKIKDLRDQLSSNRKADEVLLEANTYLRNWIIDHIIKEDMRYCPFVKCL